MTPRHNILLTHSFTVNGKPNSVFSTQTCYCKEKQQLTQSQF